jgi:hypothetical protein
MYPEEMGYGCSVCRMLEIYELSVSDCAVLDSHHSTIECCSWSTHKLKECIYIQCVLFNGYLTLLPVHGKER